MIIHDTIMVNGSKRYWLCDCACLFLQSIYLQPIYL